MEDLPGCLSPDDLVRGLAEFGITPAATEYAPVGFGDYHWRVTGRDGARWFATVADLEHKQHCGRGPVAAMAGLRKAMDTAFALRGLRFVVAPVPAGNGDTVVTLDDRYALSVFPFVVGTTGEFGQPYTAVGPVLDLLAELHSQPPPETVPVAAIDLPGREQLLGGGEWADGPFSAAARELVTANAAMLRARLAEWDRLAARIQPPYVVTHGEPHPGNLILAGHYHLVDWDTVGLAVPERDLSLVSGDPAALARYTELTGHIPSASALACYRLRWSLTDVAEFVGLFRGPHARTPDTEAAWRALTATVTYLGAGP